MFVYVFFLCLYVYIFCYIIYLANSCKQHNGWFLILSTLIVSVINKVHPVTTIPLLYSVMVNPVLSLRNHCKQRHYYAAYFCFLEKFSPYLLSFHYLQYFIVIILFILLFSLLLSFCLFFSIPHQNGVKTSTLYSFCLS